MNALPTEPFPAELRHTLTVLARQLLAGAPNTTSAREQTLLGIAALLLGTRHGAMDAVRAAQHQTPAHPLAQEQTLPRARRSELNTGVHRPYPQ